MIRPIVIRKMTAARGAAGVKGETAMVLTPNSEALPTLSVSPGSKPGPA
jgi:hypothetical protein